MVRWRIRAMVAVVVMMAGIPVRVGRAQNILNPGATPGYGQETLRQNFAPDPLMIRMTSGGMISIPDAVGDTCLGDAQGYAASAPDYRVIYNGEQTGRLRFFFVGTGDTTLVIYGPDRAWYCDDDTGGNQHPLITFDAPAKGAYNIWVGSFARGDFVTGTLYVTASDRRPADFLDVEGGDLGGPVAPQALETYDLASEPVHGTAFLSGAFSPDPHTVSIRSGGRMSISRNFGLLCQGEAAGFATSAASYRLYLSGPPPGSNLQVFFLSEGDTTLAVNAPDGGWTCNDDVVEGEDLNPAVTFEPAQEGWYNIWVGSFNADEYVNGTLYITLSDRPITDFITPVDGQGGGPAIQLDPRAPPNFGTVNLSAGFEPDPHVVRMGTGGSVAVADLLPGDAACAGYVSAAPDYRIKYTAPTRAPGDETRYLLRFFFVGDGDTTLVIAAPDDSWSCDDDSGGWPNPMISFVNPQSGYYALWVGSFNRSDYIGGLLYVTEQNVTPANYE